MIMPALIPVVVMLETNPHLPRTIDKVVFFMSRLHPVVKPFSSSEKR